SRDPIGGVSYDETPRGQKLGRHFERDVAAEAPRRNKRRLAQAPLLPNGLPGHGRPANSRLGLSRPPKRHDPEVDRKQPKNPGRAGPSSWRLNALDDEELPWMRTAAGLGPSESQTATAPLGASTLRAIINPRMLRNPHPSRPRGAAKVDRPSLPLAFHVLR